VWFVVKEQVVELPQGPRLDVSPRISSYCDSVQIEIIKMAWPLLTVVEISTVPPFSKPNVSKTEYPFGVYFNVTVLSTSKLWHDRMWAKKRRINSRGRELNKCRKNCFAQTKFVALEEMSSSAAIELKKYSPESAKNESEISRGG
jgi:hypothetical protein